jgi:hypothetical protein
MMDENSDDYGRLRLQLTQLKQLKQLYDFHERCENDGDNAIWHHGRAGVEHFSNYGLVKIRKSSLCAPSRNSSHAQQRPSSDRTSCRRTRRHADAAAAPMVITKNKHENSAENFRPAPRRRGVWLDGDWRGQPKQVSAGAAFVAHYVEREASCGLAGISKASPLAKTSAISSCWTSSGFTGSPTSAATAPATPTDVLSSIRKIRRPTPITFRRE